MADEILVLLVEDEPLVLYAIQCALEDGGYAVLAAVDGTQAVALLDSRNEDISGLVIDIRLSNGPSGWEVARCARQLRPQIPVVYISGDSGSDWSAEGVPKSVMLQKPFADAQLLTAISTLLIETDAT